MEKRTPRDSAGQRSSRGGRYTPHTPKQHSSGTGSTSGRSTSASGSHRSGGFGGGRSSGFRSSRPSSGFRGRPSGNRNAPRKQRGEYIDVSRFIKKAVPMEEKKEVIQHTFADFKLSARVNANLAKKNFVTPSPIQDKAIPHALAGSDVIGLAATGTGKTAAFLLPIIEKIVKNKNERALIIAPTRELAIQIEAEFRIFAEGMGMFSAVLVGGVPAYSQKRSLERRPHLIIGTPGRLNDFATQRIINYGVFNTVVLDEVDRMLDMGFVDEIKKILKQTPVNKQSLFFSATMPPKIRELVHTFMKDPVTVEISSGHTAQNVDQDIVRVSHHDDKLPTLTNILKDNSFEKVLIFSETKRSVEKLERDLIRHGFKATSIHGDKRQNQRQKAVSMFKDGKATILIATDVAARGIDIKDVTHVINYTTPQTYDAYVHRIGRTGRGGKMGKALTFVV